MAKKKTPPKKSAKKPQTKAKTAPPAKKGAPPKKAAAAPSKGKAPVKVVAKAPLKAPAKAPVPAAKGKALPAGKAAAPVKGSAAAPAKAPVLAKASVAKGKPVGKQKPPVPRLPPNFFGKPVIGSLAPEKKQAPKKKTPALTSAEIEKLRHRLLEEKARISGTVHGMRNEALESGDTPSGDNIADHGTDVYEQDMTLSLVEREQSTIQAIDEALSKIADGTYGRCENCEDNIRKERLEFLPHARHCLDCQEAQESAHA